MDRNFWIINGFAVLLFLSAGLIRLYS
jgi:hypothetical protein